MGFLSNTNNEIIIDAILTKYGREKLAAGDELGITKFALSDDEVDYILYNTENPYGSDYYDIAIRKLPVLEPVPSATTTMRYRLFTSLGYTSTPYTVMYSPPGDFTTGIYQTNYTTTITPNIRPEPENLADLNSVWYKFEFYPWTDVDVRFVRFEGKLDTGKTLTSDLQAAMAEHDNKVSEGKTVSYAVGHSLSVSTTSLLYPNKRTFVIMITGYGPGLSTQPKLVKMTIDKNAIPATTTTVS